MTGHRVTIDWATGLPTEGDPAAAAFCDTEGCTWRGRWHHADEYPQGNWESDPSAAEDQAFDAATRDGREHTANTDPRHPLTVAERSALIALSGRTMSLTEAATLAGVKQPAASNWPVRYDDFPVPVLRLRDCPLYDRAELSAWVAAHLAQRSHAAPGSRPAFRGA